MDAVERRPEYVCQCNVAVCGNFPSALGLHYSRGRIQ